MSGARIEENAGDSPPQLFQWRAHPARERPQAAIGAIVVILALGIVVLFSFGLGWGILAVGLLTVVLNRFFFSSRFTIDSDGITAAYPFRTMYCRWSDLRRFVHDSHGGFLSTRARRSWLDSYSGMHILFGTNRQLVMTHIQQAMKEASEAWAG